MNSTCRCMLEKKKQKEFYCGKCGHEENNNHQIIPRMCLETSEMFCEICGNDYSCGPQCRHDEFEDLFDPLYCRYCQSSLNDPRHTREWSVFISYIKNYIQQVTLKDNKKDILYCWSRDTSFQFCELCGLLLIS